MSYETDPRFKHHPPSNFDVIGAHENVRAFTAKMAEYFETDIPNCRERSLALTKLEEAMFWANAAVARTQLKEQETSK